MEFSPHLISALLLILLVAACSVPVAEDPIPPRETIQNSSDNVSEILSGKNTSEVSGKSNTSDGVVTY